MIATQTVELKLPEKIYTNQQVNLQRSVIQHLLMEEEITMSDALALLTMDDQQWLVNSILNMAQENLFVASQISDQAWSEKYWKRYNDLLGYLFAWFHKESDFSYHGQLLAILRTITRRYTPQKLTSVQIELLQRLTLRLSEKRLSQKDILAITHAVEESGLHTLLNLSPVADKLFVSYADELERS